MMEERETKELENQNIGTSSRVQSQFEVESDGNEEEEDFESITFPAISPISNVSTSSGFISCGSSSSSKPTTPIPSSSHQSSILSGDKTSDEDDLNTFGNNAKDTNSTDDKITDIPFDTGTSVIGEKSRELAIIDHYGESDSKRLSSRTSSAKGIKFRSKYSNLSLDQISLTTMRYRKKISLDDEVGIYESDSSVVESRRRISNKFCQPQSFVARTDNEERASVATIGRHKSEENSSSQQQPSNQIVSILKRKDSAGTGNQSPSLVTFSPNVKDIEASAITRSAHRRGILKKRSSLDESSRRYRSHSPSSASSENEKGCMRKNDRRRNSCEEIHHQQGILKQKSYESTGYSSSSGINTPNSSSSGVQGILKKPSLTPSDHASEHLTKHVSILEAVFLAAADCKDMIIDDLHEPYIKPILKLDNNDHNQIHEIKPKPILKKIHSSENEEIRSILKSRKSSRDEDNNL